MRSTVRHSASRGICAYDDPDGRSAAIHPMTAEGTPRQNVTATDDFDDEVKRAAAAFAADRCSNPYCRVLTRGPTNDRTLLAGVESEQSMSRTLGVTVAISAMAPGGRRYDARLSDAQRHDERNAVSLWHSCVGQVGNDVARFPAELLRSSKRKPS